MLLSNRILQINISWPVSLWQALIKTNEPYYSIVEFYIPGGGKLKEGGNLGTIAAGWFWTRTKKASVGSGNTISSYTSTTTGFFVDWGDSSSGYNFNWWYLWNHAVCKSLLLFSWFHFLVGFVCKFLSIIHVAFFITRIFRDYTVPHTSFGL